MARYSGQVAAYSTWEEAVAEAIRAGKVYAEKFPDSPRQVYVVRKRRLTWKAGSNVRTFGVGRDMWRVFTGTNVPDRRD